MNSRSFDLNTSYFYYSSDTISGLLSNSYQITEDSTVLYLYNSKCDSIQPITFYLEFETPVDTVLTYRLSDENQSALNRNDIDSILLHSIYDLSIEDEENITLTAFSDDDTTIYTKNQYGFIQDSGLYNKIDSIDYGIGDTISLLLKYEFCNFEYYYKLQLKVLKVNVILPTLCTHVAIQSL